MTTSDTYNVVTTGQVLDGFNLADVQKRLVSALRMKPEAAATFFEKARVIKKNAPRAQADKICAQLAKIGVVAKVQSLAPPTPTPPTEPTPEAPAAMPSQLEIVDYQSDKPPKEATVECPSCGQEQAKAEQCESCGAWFHKFDPSFAPPESVAAKTAVAAEDAASPAEHSGQHATSKHRDDSDSAINPVAIGAAAVAALVGAWVWKLVAVNFGFEFGLIAWAIGGAVGFAAAAAGSRGVQAGIICGVIAFGGIVLGKYWSYGAFLDEFQESFAGEMVADESMSDYYEEELADALAYVNGSGSEDFVRQFMVERGYSYESDPAKVSDAELDEFREYVAPTLREMAQSPPSFEEWQTSSIEAVSEISPWAMVVGGFGLLDIVFLFLGVGTAYRLGSQEG